VGEGIGQQEQEVARLLRESAVLRRRSDELAHEAERLRAVVRTNGARDRRSGERRKKPKLRGK
jgi:hypothetical protein